jgi:hypothetical protein
MSTNQKTTGLLCILVLAFCGAGWGQDIVICGEDLLAGDANEPAPPDANQPWDPAEHLTATWESVSVSMTSRLYNPAVRPEQQVKDSEWSLSLTGQIDVTDPNGLLGLSLITTSALALDEEGRVVSTAPATGMPVRMYWQPRFIDVPSGPNGKRVSQLFPNHFSVSLPMAPDAKYPAQLSRVEWSMYVLVAEQFRTVDIPFEANEVWVEVTPGLEVLVEQAVVEENTYRYRLKVRYDKSQVDYLPSGSMSLWRDEAPPALAVVNMGLLNAEGKSVRGSGGGSFSDGGGYSGSNNQMTGTASGSGTCDACGTAAIIRYTLAQNMYEREVRFALEDIPVPSF